MFLTTCHLEKVTLEEDATFLLEIRTATGKVVGAIHASHLMDVMEVLVSRMNTLEKIQTQEFLNKEASEWKNPSSPPLE